MTPTEPARGTAPGSFTFSTYAAINLANAKPSNPPAAIPKHSDKESFDKYLRKNLPRQGPERQTDAELSGAPTHGECRISRHSNHRDEKGEHSEASEDQSVQSIRSQYFSANVLERCSTLNWLVG